MLEISKGWTDREKLNFQKFNLSSSANILRGRDLKVLGISNGEFFFFFFGSLFLKREVFEKLDPSSYFYNYLEDYNLIG